MNLTKFDDEFFIVQNRYHDDDEINIIINIIIDYFDEVEEFATEEEASTAVGIICKHFGITEFDSSDLPNLLIQLCKVDCDKIFDIYDELEAIGAFEEKDDEYYGSFYDDFEDEEDEEIYIAERLVKKFVIRGGKKVRIKRTDRAGYTTQDGKEKRMGSKERRIRKISQRKASRKRRAKLAGALRRREKSMRKRNSTIKN